MPIEVLGLRVREADCGVCETKDRCGAMWFRQIVCAKSPKSSRDLYRSISRSYLMSQHHSARKLDQEGSHLVRYPHCTANRHSYR